LSGRRRLAIVSALAALAAGQEAVVRSRAAQEPAAARREEAYRANNLGVARLEQYLYADAASQFSRALTIEPALHVARVNLALAWLYDNRVEDAAREAARAVKDLPGSPRAHYVQGLAARLQNRADEAAAAFERVLQIDAGDVGSLIYLGQGRLQARRFEEAATLFRRALEAEPYNATAAYNLAVALTRSGARDEGQRAMERFQSLRDSAYAVTYAQVYLEQGRYGEALASTGAEADLVDTQTPPARFADVSAEWFRGIAPLGPLPQFQGEVAGAGVSRDVSAHAANGALVLLDLDDEGDLDLVAAEARRLRAFRNNGRGRLEEITSDLGLGEIGDALVTGVVAGDLDNDGAADLVALTSQGLRLFRGHGARFRDVTTEVSLPPLPALPRTAALADVDHDGDLDLVVAGSVGDPAENRMILEPAKPPPVAPAPGATQLLRNNGNLTFTDISSESQVSVANHFTTIIPTDWDNRRDMDLLLLAESGPFGLQNARDGSFRRESRLFEIPDAVGVRDFTAATAADVNKDGFVDFFFGRVSYPGYLGMSDGTGRITWSLAPPATAGALIAMFADYDSDGLLDLFVTGLGRTKVLRNVGSEWRDVTGHALAGMASKDVGRSLAMGDLDGDGDVDALVRTTFGLTALRNDSGRPTRSAAVRLEARVSNRSAAGARVEMRSGSLKQRLEVSATTPPIAPADLIFGVGARTRVDVIRVLWPAGILQAETDLPSPAAPALAGRTLTVTELDRKPSSCPYLFTWNGERFEFVTDFLGGGEMGAWMGPGVRNVPDPEEYVRITDNQLEERNGRLELRITNELEEVLFLDRLRLLAVDHPQSVEIFPNEGLTTPPFKPFQLHGVRDLRAPGRAVDDGGRNLMTDIAALDRRFAEGFGIVPIRGYAEEHALILDVGPRRGREALVLTGWTDYAFSSDNVAASQRGLRMVLPRLDERRPDGTWRLVSDRVGFPVGRPQTLIVPLPEQGRQFRVVTSMRIYWDQVQVGTLATQADRTMTAIDPVTAVLGWRGFSAETSPDGREPFAYDYRRVSNISPWKTFPGSYTREGDVRPLLAAVDDMFVVARPGDEVAVSFDARALPGLTPGLARTYLLHAHGYSKEMDINSSSPDTVGPLPFGRMTAYPYGAGESYPGTTAHRHYQNSHNTRRVRTSVPSIDAASAIRWEIEP
jgi:tetratricopeptide (TPR) repeat protein